MLRGGRDWECAFCALAGAMSGLQATFGWTAYSEATRRNSPSPLLSRSRFALDLLEILSQRRFRSDLSSGIRNADVGRNDIIFGANARTSKFDRVAALAGIVS